MSEEEYMECSVVAYPRQIRFLHINGGAISYYVDRHVSDYVDRLQQENQKLKKQLEYLRSGEYYNQLRFERDMLQNVVDNGEVSKEDKEFIDMTQRNTELLEENQKLKKQLENKYEKVGTLTGELLYEENTKLINQQKEFIKWLEDYLNLFDYRDIEEQAGYDMLEEILQKYKDIIGVENENNIS